MVDIVAIGDPGDDKDDVEDDHCEVLLDVGCRIWLVVIVPPSPAVEDALFLPSVTVLVTIDTSPAGSVVAGNSIMVRLPAIPVVTTVIVRVMLVELLDDMDVVDDVASGQMLLLL